MTAKKTPEQFEKEVFILLGDEYKVVSNYLGSRSKIVLRHSVCNKEWSTTPGSILKGSRCLHCSGRNKKTQNDLVGEVKRKVGNEYAILGEYVNTHTPILMRHNKCGYEWKVRPKLFLHGTKYSSPNGTRCPKCAGLLKKSTLEFKQEVYDLVKDEYTVLDEYKNRYTKVNMQHNLCNYIWSIKPQDFLKGVRCPLCGKMHTKTQDFFEEEVFNIGNGEFEVLGKYINSKTSILMRHKTCNYEWKTPPENFLLRGAKCPRCVGVYIKTLKIFKEQVYNLVDNEYSVLGDYKNGQHNILMRHNACNYEWLVRPNNFLNGSRCPNCLVTKGESKIKKYLIDNEIRYRIQYTFPDCKDILRLKFDFAVFKNRKLSVLIEYDGEFHYEQIISEEHFADRKKKDKIKDDYCKSHNIPLIRIPYWEFDNIESILNEKLAQLNILPVSPALS
ncbi:hypothetical protein ACWA2B_10990 [Paenibacillus sp. CMM36]